MLFRRGYGYFGGFDKPFVASVSRIRDELEKAGFRVDALWECPNCDPEWDWLGLVRRTGPTADIEVPSRVKWVRELPPSQPSNQVPTMLFGPFPFGVNEDCDTAARHCATVGWRLGGCSTYPEGGGLYTCEGEAPPVPTPQPTKPKKPPFPWGIAAVGLLLGGVAVAAYYTDPSR